MQQLLSHFLSCSAPQHIAICCAHHTQQLLSHAPAVCPVAHLPARHILLTDCGLLPHVLCSPVLMRAERYDAMRDTLDHLFNVTEVVILDDFRLGVLLAMDRYPDSYDYGSMDMNTLGKMQAVEHLGCPVLKSDRSGVLSLSPWQSYAQLLMRIYCSDGSHVDVRWWDLKALLLPDRPPNDILVTMSAEQQNRLWRAALVPATPESPCAEDVGSLPGVILSPEGHIVA